MKRVFKCAMEGDERRFRSVKRSSLGMPKCTPNKYSRRLKHPRLGMPPMHSLLHQQSSVCLSLHYIFIASCVMCFAWSVSLFTFLGLFCFVCCSNKLDPNLLFFVWERYTLRLNQNSSQDLHAFSFSCECSFSFLSCCSVQLQSFSFLEICFCLRLNFLQVACFVLLESLPVALSFVS